VVALIYFEFFMKKVISFGALMLTVLFLSGCSIPQTSQSQPVKPAPQAQPVQPPAPQSAPVTTNQQEQTAPTAATYVNEKYGLKITFPAEVKSFEKVETPLESSRAYNPVFSTEFGKDKNDFFEADGMTHGNMLTVWIYDRKKCNALKLDEIEKDFCNANKTDNANGILRGGDITRGYWFGNQDYLYNFTAEGDTKLNGLLSKIKVELLNN